MNAGFLEAMKMFSFDCAIFHDVDLIPEHDGNLYDCGDQPRHLSVAIDKMNYKYVICYYLLRLLSLLMNKKKNRKKEHSMHNTVEIRKLPRCVGPFLLL